MKRQLSIASIYKLKERIYKKTSFLVGRELDGDTASILSRETAKALGKNVVVEPVYLSVIPGLGETITAKKLLRFCERMAGNVPELESFRAVHEWVGQPKAAASKAEILSVERVYDFQGRSVYELTVKLHSGPAAGHIAKRRHSRGILGVIANKLGYSPFNKPYPFYDPLQLVLLHAVVYLKPVPSKDGLPCLDTTWEAGLAERTFNRKVIKARLEKDDVGSSFRCPHRISVPCYHCPAGYQSGPRVCDVACREKGLHKKICGSCETMRFFANKEDKHCLRCEERRKAAIAAQRRKELKPRGNQRSD